jgi:hypothetical protein
MHRHAFAFAFALLLAACAPAPLPPGMVLPLEGRGEDAIHVEYPTVYTAADGTHVMLYSALGKDHRWRIKRAIEKDGRWVDRQRIFDEAALPFPGAYAFPFVVRVGASAYELYFAGRTVNKGPYDGLYRTQSRNGLAWGPPARILTGIAVDPYVSTDAEGRRDLFFTRGASVLRMRSRDGLRWSAPVTAYTVDPASNEGIYTLGGITLDGRRLLVIEHGRSDTKQGAWRVFCVSDGGLTPSPKSPLLAFDASRERGWNTVKYGMFLTVDAATPPDMVDVYYNGVRFYQAPREGQVGHMRIKRQTVNDMCPPQ